MARKKVSFWIQSANVKKGALKQQIKTKYGGKAFTGRGTIKTEYLEKATKEGGKLARRANLALTLRKLKKR